MKKFLLVAAAGLVTACSTHSGSYAPLPTQANIDLNKYVGTWYEQALLPNSFQDQCVANVRAEYVLNDDKSITVTNSCQLKDGKTDVAVGQGRLAQDVEPQDPAKLEIRFAPAALSWVPAVWGDYWILKTQGDYEYSLVGTRDRQYLWVLSREKNADTAVVQELLNYAGTLGYAVDKVKLSKQN